MAPTPNSPQNQSELVFTSSQAARYLGVSLATVRRWTDAGFLIGYRTPGGQRRFSREQLDGFIASLQRTGERHSGQRSRQSEAGAPGAGLQQESAPGVSQLGPRSISRVA